MRVAALAPVILFIAAVCSPLHAQQAETVLLVRHADRASNAPESLLSAQGEQRAECLAQTLRTAGVTRIYATDVRRTQQTAEPLARVAHVQVTVVPKKNTAELIKDIRADAGRTVLVVGHADTLDGIVEQLGGGKIAPFGDNEYDRLIIVPLVGNMAGRTVTIRYCAPMPASK
jgi:phosphohistidine phosphatase SixA